MPVIPRRWRSAFLLGLALIVFLPMVGARDIVTSHEARVAQTARQMAAAGWPWQTETVAVPVVGMKEVDGMKRLAPLPGEGTMTVNPWLVPVMNGQIRLQKPPLPYWCSAVMFKGLGFGEGAARLPAAVLGAAAVLLVFDLGRLLYGRRVGWLAGLVWVSSYFVFDEFRKAMADPYLAFFSLLSIWAWVRGAKGKWGVGSGEVGSEEDRPASSLPTAYSPLPYVLTFYLSLALGALAKAPVNFLHVVLALGAYHLCFRRRAPGRWWQHGLGFALFLAVGLPWPLYILRHVPHAMELWRYESVGEFADNTEKARGWWYYLPAVFQIGLPWTPVWVVGVVGAVARARRSAGRRRGFVCPPVLFPVLWLAATLVVFSASNVKKNAYLLPVMPAMALITARGLAWVIAGARRPKTRGRAEAVLVAMMLVGVVFALALPTLIAGATGHRARGLAWVVVGVTGLAAALAAGLPAFAEWRRRGPGAWALAQAVVFAVLVAAFFDFANAAADNRRSAKPVCRVVQKMLERPDTTLLTSALPEEASVYLPPGVTFDPSRPRVLVIVDDRANTARQDYDWFQARLPGARVVEVQRLLPASSSTDRRWKLFQVTLDRKWVAIARPA